MTITVRGTPVAQNGGGSLFTTINWTLPTGSAVGDLCFLFLHTAPGAATVTGPTGWTQHVNGDTASAKLGLWSRVLDASDVSAGTISTGRSASSTYSSGLIGYFGSVGSVVVDVVSSVQSNAASTVSQLIADVTPSVNDCLRLGFVGMRVTTAATAATGTPPGSWTEQVDTIDTHASAQRRLAVIDTIQLTGQAGVAQGTATMTTTQAGTGGSYSVTIVEGAPAGPPTNPTGSYTLGVLGDSLTVQYGNGPTDIEAVLVADGWVGADVEVDGVTGRTIVGGGSTPTSETQIDTWRAASFDPKYWIIALGTNNQSGTNAAIKADIRTLLAKIGPNRFVRWIGTGYYDQSDCTWTYNGGGALGSRYSAVGVNGSPNAAVLNVIEEGTNPATEPTVVFWELNTDTAFRTGSTNFTEWLSSDTSSGTSQPRHMTTHGYQNFRNPFYVRAVTADLDRAVVTGTATIAAGAAVTRPAAATLAVTATFGATAAVTRPGAAAVAATATIAAAGRLAPASAAASLTGTATISTTGSTSGALAGDATLTGTATIAATAAVLRPAASTVTGTVAITAGATRTALPAASLAAAGAITAGAAVTVLPAATLGATATISTTGVVGLVVTLTATAAISTTAVVTRFIAATVLTVASIAAAAQKTAAATATVSAVAAISTSADTVGLLPPGGTLVQSRRTVAGMTTAARSIATLREGGAR